MLLVEIDGKMVDMAGGSTLKLDLISPYLMYDAIPSSGIAAPVFPATDNNQQVFKWWHEAQSGGALSPLMWRHFYNGELIKEGYFRMKKASIEKGYEGDFDDKLSNFFGDYHDKNLQEINFGVLPLTTLTTGVVSDGGSVAYCLPTIVNADYFGTNASSYTGKMNDYATGAYKANSSTPKVPMFFVKYIIQKISTLTGISITGSFLTHAAFSQLFLYNTREVPGSTVTIQQHLPELTLINFFIELRKLPNLSFTFSAVNKNLNIDFWEDDLAQPTTIDWTSKALLGETKTPETRTRLQLGYELDSGDALVKDKPADLADYVTPALSGALYSDIAKVSSKFSTTLVDVATGLPAVKQVGVTSQFGQLTQKFAPRLLFWQGIKNGFPFSGPVSADGSKSLYWGGANGLRLQQWTKTEAFFANRFYLDKNFALNEMDLAKLDFRKKIHVQGVNYLLAAVSIENPIKSAARCLLISCP